jgi:hypothetical protein
MNERTTVRLPPELLRRAKRKAAADGSTLTALIEEGLRRVLSERKPISDIAHKPPPVSTATGGLRPGVTLDLHKLQEEDDLEYVKRMRLGDTP